MSKEQPDGLPQIRVVDASARAALIATITLAFTEDPIMRYLYPESAVYLRYMPDFVAAFCAPAFDRGLCLTTEGYRGAACWARPGEGEATLPPALFSAVDPVRLGELSATLAAVAPLHPQEPYWYLPQIGVDPAARGQGVGAALMKEAIRVIDESGAPAFLESSNPRNISLYERFGFEALEQIQIGDAPAMIPMRRSGA